MSWKDFRPLSALCLGFLLSGPVRAQDPAAPSGVPAEPQAAVSAPPPVVCPDPPKPPATWHGHKYPVQPLAPPGAAPILPTGSGYYTLLQMVQGTPGAAPPRWPYQRTGPIMMPFFENNFSYLDSIPFADRDWAEKLKRIPVGNHWLFSTGGEVRYRYNSETNSQLTGRSNDYGLIRTRAYGDVWFEDLFRFYGEFLYGEIFNNELPPLTRDVNRGDIQNMFIDARVFEHNGNPVFVRLGQQELIYGSQRLLSTNDWGNNRTRFQALKTFYRSDKWDFDVFTGRPVQVRFNDLDPGDHNQWFTGVWLTNKPRKGTFLDLYYLELSNKTPGAATGQFTTGSFNVHTLGGRYVGRNDNGFLWDVEGAVQVGNWADQDILANAFSAYLGWNWKNCCLNPTVWLGYDFASGDPDPNRTGTHRTFNQLFAFGHYYFGFLDYVGRQNIHDLTLQGYVYPAKWLTAGIQYHVFRLASPKDSLYNAFGRPVRRDPTGAAGDDVGSEIDLVFNAHITDRQDLFITYSHFFPGSFIRATGPSGDGNALYLQYSWRW